MSLAPGRKRAIPAIGRAGPSASATPRAARRLGTAWDPWIHGAVRLCASPESAGWPCASSSTTSSLATVVSSNAEMQGRSGSSIQGATSSTTATSARSTAAQTELARTCLSRPGHRRRRRDIARVASGLVVYEMRTVETHPMHVPRPAGASMNGARTASWMCPPERPRSTAAAPAIPANPDSRATATTIASSKSAPRTGRARTRAAAIVCSTERRRTWIVAPHRAPPVTQESGAAHTSRARAACAWTACAARRPVAME